MEGLAIRRWLLFWYRTWWRESWVITWCQVKVKKPWLPVDKRNKIVFNYSHSSSKFLKKLKSAGRKHSIESKLSISFDNSYFACVCGVIVPNHPFLLRFLCSLKYSSLAIRGDPDDVYIILEEPMQRESLICLPFLSQNWKKVTAFGFLS